MKKRRKLWIAVGLLVIGMAIMLVPGSPLNITDSWNADQHAGKSIKAWVDDLASPDLEVRLAAIREVGQIGAQASAGVPHLARIMIEDPDTDSRVQASFALSKMAPSSSAAVEQLAKALTDDEPLVRFNAIRALQRLKGDARPAVPALLAALKDPSNHTTARTFNYSVYQQVIRCLGSAGSGMPELVPILKDHLAASQPPLTRVVALVSLGELGPPARTIAPVIRLLSKDEDQEVRTIAIETLATLGEPLEGETAAESEKYELPEDDRRYLWKVENAGNILVKHGFGPLAAALKAGDRTAIAKMLAPGFVAADIREPKIVTSESGPQVIERREESGKPAEPITMERFLDLLLSYRRLFTAEPPGVKFNMMTLSPEKYGDLDSKIWKGTVQLRLHGESTKGAPAEIVAVFRFEMIKPIASELEKSGWLHRAELVQVQTARSPQPLFADVTKERGLNSTALYDNWRDGRFVPTTGGAFVTDYDRDGWLDLLVSDHFGVTLYRGRPGGKFVNVTAEVGLLGQPQDVTAAWVDLDGDGWDDLVANRNVYRNEQGKRFVNVTAKCNIRPPDRFTNIVIADYDRDGKLDLYFTRPGPPGGNSWLDHRSTDPNGNYLFRNLGNFQFEDVTKFANAAGGRRSTFTAAWLDANNDGWPDLVVPNEFGDGVLLVNNQNGTFSEVELSKKPADFGTMGLAVGDFNNDGNIDIYCNNMYSKAGTRVIGNMNPNVYPPHVMERLRRFVAGSQLHMNRGGLQFEQVGPEKKVAAVGWAYGVSLADFDNDGLLDIYATAGYVSRDRNEPDG